jgi:hypothetical protein
MAVPSMNKAMHIWVTCCEWQGLSVGNLENTESVSARPVTLNTNSESEIRWKDLALEFGIQDWRLLKSIRSAK